MSNSGSRLGTRVAIVGPTAGALALSALAPTGDLSPAAVAVACVGFVMAATAILSMWVSDTATTMMILPIGQSIVYARHSVPDTADASRPGPASALMLGIAYAATIGGIRILIDTPPNTLFGGLMSEAYGVEVDSLAGCSSASRRSCPVANRLADPHPRRFQATA